MGNGEINRKLETKPKFRLTCPSIIDKYLYSPNVPTPNVLPNVPSIRLTMLGTNTGHVRRILGTLGEGF